MKSGKSVLLLLALTAIPAIAADLASNANASFGPMGMSLSEVEPGARVAWMTLTRERVANHSRLRIRRGLEVADQDGTVAIAQAGADESRSIWLAAAIDDTEGLALDSTSPGYSKSTSSIDLTKGELLDATRYNYYDLYGWVYKVTHLNRYMDAAGRRTGRTTKIGTTGEYDPVKTVEIATTYDDLDLPTTVSYPMCDQCGVPFSVDRGDEVRTYDRGRLQSLSGFVSGITYWPNGMRNVMPHTNGVADTQVVGAMTRPSSIAFGKYDRCVKPKFVVQPSGASVASPGAPATRTAAAVGAGTVHQREFLSFINTENTEYLDYMNARFYDPNLGRFLSVDPLLDKKRSIREPQSWNRYSYVINNPINRIDPDEWDSR